MSALKSIERARLVDVDSARPAGKLLAVAGRRVSPSIVMGLARISQLFLLLLSGFCVATAWMGAGETFEDSRYLIAVISTSLLAVAAGHRLELFAIPALIAPVRHLPKLLVSWTVALGGLVATIFLFKVGPEFSRGWLLLWYVAGFACLAGARALIANVLGRLAAQGRLNRRAVIFGGGSQGLALIKALESDRGTDIRICGIFDDRGPNRIGHDVLGYPRLGDTDQLVNFCRESQVDLLIVSLPLTAENRLLEILKKLWVLPVDIRLAAHTSKLRFRPRAYSFVGNVPLIDLFDRPLAEWDSLMKSAFDKVIAALAIICLSPLLLAIAAAIRFDSRGPIVFRQKRLGFNNQLIDVYKFRSMYVEKADANAVRLVTKDDPRVTRVGRFIRRTSLDELPQLFNVLTGQLSLVGPRPHALQAKAADRFYHHVVDGYFARHKVKPGITGWAQINGWRGETDTSEKIQRRVEHDLYYIDNWSLFFDLYILARTPLALFKSENAY